MRVFVAGATGALGRLLVPRLVSLGHEVTGTTRSDAKREMIRAMGAVPVVVDALDAKAVARAVAEARPEVLIHQLTALHGTFGERRFERAMAATNRLRVEGTDHLLAAARAAGVARLIAQSYVGNGVLFARSGGSVKAEDAALDAKPPERARATVEALRHLETAVLGATWTEGIVLRYGSFYGPGTSMAPGAEHYEMVRKRQFPLIGDARGIWSFVHVADATDATILAMERGERGIYHITDDEPAAVATWLPAAAAAMGAKPPYRVPRWVGRLLAGEVVTQIMTESRGASNAKAKRELGWTPSYPSWRTGFAETFA